ncbi:MAG: hypothetical protein C4554_04265 [Dethiobacter sp.]|jgi:hypothetical protein|nr:MAG: hypothetical protein C4554_04265 [Dethiobacter sp.]
MAKQYLYCLIDKPKIDIIPCTGIKNCKPYFVRWKEIAAVVSEALFQSIELTSETVLSHEAVVEYLMKEHTVLPVRFGTVLNSVDEVKSLLCTYSESIYKNIDKMRDKVELGLKVLLKAFPGDDPAREEESIKNFQSATPGRRYLLEKLKNEERQRDILEKTTIFIDEIYNTLDKYSVESCIRRLTTDRMLLNSSYLVPVEKIEEFKTTVEILKRRYPALSFLYSGPWPAYNFVSLEEDESCNAKG